MKTHILLELFLHIAAHAQTGTVIARRAQVVPGLPPVPQGVRMCTATDLSLATDDENGNFDGMSHSGTLVVLRNLSTTACRVPAIPQLTFTDSHGPLKVTLVTPGFGRQPNGIQLNHGPVVPPVVVPSGAEVTSELRWVSGEVYTHSTCVTPTSLSIAIEGKPQRTAITAHLCGDAAAGGVTDEATHFKTDPVYAPDHAVRAPQLPQPE